MAPIPVTNAELRASMAALPKVMGSGPWAGYRRDLRRQVANDDPEQFINWPVVNLTMFAGDAPWTQAAWRALQGQEARWAPAITEHDLGCPPRLRWLPESSGNLVMQAYYLGAWEQIAQRSLADLTSILEVGGGYGAMCRVVRGAGFTGRYFICDYPEFALLQQYYLRGIGLDATWPQYQENWADSNAPRTVDLVIACLSLSEADPGTRRFFIEDVDAPHLLVAYQPIWGTMDNGSYFAQIASDRGAVNYPSPVVDNHWYLLR